MALGALIELELDSPTTLGADFSATDFSAADFRTTGQQVSWVSLMPWARSARGFSGRKSGLDAHLTGTGELVLRSVFADHTLPATLGGFGSRIAAQGKRVRFYVLSGAVKVLLWVGWIQTVEWARVESLNEARIRMTDVLGILGADVIDLFQRQFENLDVRMEAVLAEAGYTVNLPRTTNQAAAMSESYAGSVASYLQICALSDAGLFVAAPDLDTPFRLLPQGYTPARTVRISDQATAPALRWNRRPVVEVADDHTVNIINYTLEDGRRRTIRDQASIDEYGGPRPLSREFICTPTGGSTVASVIIDTHKEPVSIPRRANVALHLEPAALHRGALEAAIGDLCEGTVTNTDGVAVSYGTLIDGIGWSMYPLGEDIGVDLEWFLIPTVGASVPQPVRWPSVPDYTAHAGREFVAALPGARGGTGAGLTYSVGSLPSWLSFDARTITLSGNPPFTGGPWTVSVTATDQGDSGRTASIDVEITLRVEPLALPTPNDLRLASGQVVSVTLPAASGGSGSFTYALTGLPAGLALTGRAITGFAPADPAAATTLTYIAADTEISGSTIRRTFTLTVADRAISWPAPPAQTAVAGSAWSYTFPAAAGASGRGFDYTATGKPSWVSLTGRTLSGTPPWTAAQSTDYAITLRATDPVTGQIATITVDLTASVEPLGFASSQADIDIAAGQELDG